MSKYHKACHTPAFYGQRSMTPLRFLSMIHLLTCLSLLLTLSFSQQAHNLSHHFEDSSHQHSFSCLIESTEHSHDEGQGNTLSSLECALYFYLTSLRALENHKLSQITLQNLSLIESITFSLYQKTIITLQYKASQPRAPPIIS